MNNIVWPRVEINSIVETVCPASRYMDPSQSNTSKYTTLHPLRLHMRIESTRCYPFFLSCFVAIRACDVVPGEKYVARWAAPSNDACLSIEHNDLRHSLRELKELVRVSNATAAVDLIASAFQVRNRNTFLTDCFVKACECISVCA